MLTVSSPTSLTLRSRCAPAVCGMRLRKCARSYEWACHRSLLLSGIGVTCSHRAAICDPRCTGRTDGFAHDVRSLSVGSCSGIDFATAKSDDEIRAYGQQFIGNGCKNTTFIPMPGVPLSFAILNPRKNESQK